MKKLHSRSLRTSRTLSFLCFFFFLFASFPLHAETDPAFILKKIEQRRGTWITLRSKIQMDFLSAEKQKASCFAELLYHRLDDKLLLKGFDPDGQLLFVLKTSDLSYELFLPAKSGTPNASGALYRGNIFDLEQSPEIESHLRALDLYRALKPMGFKPDNATVTEESAEKSLLRVERKFKGSGVISRKLEVSPNGDITKETYYTVAGKPAVTVRRSDLKPAANSKVLFPGQILLSSHLAAAGKRGVRKTRITFLALELYPDWVEADWDWQAPPGAQIFSTETRT